MSNNCDDTRDEDGNQNLHTAVRQLLAAQKMSNNCDDTRADDGNHILHKPVRQSSSARKMSNNRDGTRAGGSSELNEVRRLPSRFPPRGKRAAAEEGNASSCMTDH